MEAKRFLQSRYSPFRELVGVALWASPSEDEVCSTIESKIVYFKAVSSGTLTCEARLVQKSKNFAVMECEIKNDGNLAAKAIRHL